VEKNEVISIAKYSGPDGKNAEFIKIFKVPKNKTLDEMLELPK
jgi:hypothetical protein